MYPDLFHIGPVPIRSFGVMMALSFLFGVLYIMKIAKRDGKPFDQYLTVAYLMIFAGLVGARLGYVVFHLEEFDGKWLDIINPFHSGQFGIAGLNLYGGVLLAIASTVVYCRVVKIPVLELFDYFAPTLGLGIGVSRIGCFLNGCCFGTPTDLPWGIKFPAGSIPSFIFGDAHIHPAQIYSSIYGFGLFIALHFLLKRRAFVGQVVAVLFMSEAVFRYLIENVRYYESEMIFHIGGSTLTYNQVISAALFVIGMGLYLIQRRRPIPT